MPDPTKLKHEDTGLALARSTLGGKKSNFLKAACSDELKDLLVRRLAAIRTETGRNVSESEFVEKAVAIALLGLDHVVRVEVEHQQKLAGYWSSAVQPQAEVPR